MMRAGICGEALRLARESRIVLVAARTLNSAVKRMYAWQKAAPPPLTADPAEIRVLRAANKWLVQALGRLKSIGFRYIIYL